MITDFNIKPHGKKYHAYGKSWRNINRKTRPNVAALLKGLSFLFTAKDKKVTQYRLW